MCVEIFNFRLIALSLFYVSRYSERRIVAMASKLERDFQAKLIKELKERFEGCIVLKNDSSYIQGIPDLLVLYNDKWCAIECKRSLTASHRPNQEYYVGLMDEMSFARFVCPENKEDVLDELEHAFCD